jgi:hypothetical protein
MPGIRVTYAGECAPPETEPLHAVTAWSANSAARHALFGECWPFGPRHTRRIDRARGRRWLDEIVAGTVTSVEQIAARDKCSIRQVNMTISLAFLAPDLVKVAVEPSGPANTRCSVCRFDPGGLHVQLSCRAQRPAAKIGRRRCVRPVSSDRCVGEVDRMLELSKVWHLPRSRKPLRSRRSRPYDSLMNRCGGRQIFSEGSPPGGEPAA